MQPARPLQNILFLLYYRTVYFYWKQAAQESPAGAVRIAGEFVMRCLTLSFVVTLLVGLTGSAAGAGPIQSADQNGNRSIELSELLRVIQFFNGGGFHCDPAQEDGYAPGPEGDHTCAPHDADYLLRDWRINLTELLRLIQIHNVGAYCRAGNTEDGYLPGDGIPASAGLERYYVPVPTPEAANAPTYLLPLQLQSIPNWETFNTWFGLSSLSNHIEQNGFVVFPYDLAQYVYGLEHNDDIVLPYTLFNESEIPVFVTSDIFLHLYHVQFDETLKTVEETEFVPDIETLTAALLQDAQETLDTASGDLQEAARRNLAFLAVAQSLITPASTPPTSVAAVVTAELQKINAHAGPAQSDLFIYREDYSQYVPRGHYTRSEALERYFRTMMWYGRMAFLLKGAEDWGPGGEAIISEYDARIQTMQAALIAQALNTVQAGGRNARDIWDRIYVITSFYVGVADDLTPYEYRAVIERLFGTDADLALLEIDTHYFDLKAELALLRSPRIYGGTGDIILTPPVSPDDLNTMLEETKGMRFMGQRFIPDSYLFQRLVFPAVEDYTGGLAPLPFTCGSTGLRLARCYPRGLDVMTILGSQEAANILADEGDTAYLYYEDRLEELKAEFSAFDESEWTQNLYWGWLHALQPLLEVPDPGYPAFMQNTAWLRKQLNAALASWTELRHDTILYAKQSYTGSETSVPNIPPGYIEPIPEFYARLTALTRMTRTGLDDLDALTDTAELRLVRLENLLERALAITEKELTGESLTEDDCEFLTNIGEALEALTTGVSQAGIKTTLAADVHTHGAEGLVVEEGRGRCGPHPRRLPRRHRHALPRGGRRALLLRIQAPHERTPHRRSLARHALHTATRPSAHPGCRMS